MADRVAVIGAGAMGGAIARRLIAQGMDLTVCDVDPARLADFAALGARTTLTPADCAEAETVLIVVATAAQLAAVVSGEGGLSQRAGQAPMKRVAVMSTVPVDALHATQAALLPSGVRVVDAPVSGGGDRALAGQMTVIAGGDAADLADLAPVFDLMASNVFHCGPVGAGQMTKIVNNVICHANVALTAEVMKLGQSHGLSAEAMRQVMEVSSGRNYLTNKPEGIAAFYAGLAPDKAAFDGILAVLKKDVNIARDLTDAAPMDYPAIRGVAEVITGLGDETFATWTALSTRESGG